MVDPTSENGETFKLRLGEPETTLVLNLAEVRAGTSSILILGQNALKQLGFIITLTNDFLPPRLDLSDKKPENRLPQRHSNSNHPHQLRITM